MAVIQDYMNGACHITVYDDKIRPPEEVKKIIDNVSRIIYTEELRKHMAEMEERMEKK